MEKPYITILFLLGLLINSVTGISQSQPQGEARIICQFTPGISMEVTENRTVLIHDQSINSVLSSFGDYTVKALAGSKKRNGSLREMHEIPVVMIFEETVDVSHIISELQNLSVVNVAEPDFIGEGHGLCEVEPNDQYFYNRQWSLYNDGTFNNSSEDDADIDMNHAWTISKGSTTTVASTLDSGIKPDHPEFNGRIWYNSGETPSNNLDDDNNGYTDDLIGWDFANTDNDPTDDHGHGTNVTGIFGANGNNNVGYAGVDWNCKLMTCKVLTNANWGYYSWWTDAMYYSVDEGADVINMSLGGSSYSSIMEVAANYAYNNDVPVVVSMGNNNNSVPSYPAYYNSVIAVGATDVDNERTNPFSWGGGSNYGSNIDISAPGNRIYGLSYNSNTYYNSAWSGTSQAAPHVTGVVSLIKGLNPSITVDSVRTLLFEGASDQVGLPSEDVSGWDQYHGHGVLNAYKTLLLATAERDTNCGDYISPSGKVWQNNGRYFDTLQTSAGCDSVFVLDIMIGDVDSNFSEVTTCDEYPWPEGDTTLSTSGIYYTSFQNQLGCDSTLVLNLEINPSKSDDFIEFACNEYYWELDDNTYTSSGEYTWEGETSKGCDSLIVLNLVILSNDASIDQNGPVLESNLLSDTYQWVHCDNFVYEPIEGATESSFEADSNGYYALVTSINGCVDTSECVLVSSLAVDDAISNTRIHVYPNPAFGSIYIQTPIPLEYVKLLSSTGKLIMEGTNSELQVENISEGLYFLHVNTEEDNVVKKVLIQR